MPISDFREIGESPDRPNTSPLGNILQAFPPTTLDVHYRNGYIFRLDPCNVVTGYNPDYCDEHTPKVNPSFYGPNVQVPVRMLQTAFACSTVGTTDDELRHWAKSPLQLRLWSNVDTILTALLSAQAVDQTPFPLPAADVLAKAAQYLSTNGQSGTGVIYGPQEWLSTLGMDYLIRWDETNKHYRDSAGNIIIPSSVDNAKVYAFDSFVDIKTSDIQILDEFMPGQRQTNDRTVRAEQLYTVAIGPCVVGSFDVGITAIGDSVIVEPGSFPINVNIVGPDPLPVTIAGGSPHLACATDFVTVCPGEEPLVVEILGVMPVSGSLPVAFDTPVPVTFVGDCSGNPIPVCFDLSYTTDSVTIRPGPDPIPVTLSGGSLLMQYITGATTTVVKATPGTFYRISVLDGSGVNTVTIYDNTAGSGPIIAIINVAKLSGTIEFGGVFTVGLTVVSTGADTKLSVVYL